MANYWCRTLFNVSSVLYHHTARTETYSECKKSHYGNINSEKKRTLPVTKNNGLVKEMKWKFGNKINANIACVNEIRRLTATAEAAFNWLCTTVCQKWCQLVLQDTTSCRDEKMHFYWRHKFVTEHDQSCNFCNGWNRNITETMLKSLFHNHQIFTWKFLPRSTRVLRWNAGSRTTSS